MVMHSVTFVCVYVCVCVCVCVCKFYVCESKKRQFTHLSVKCLCKNGPTAHSSTSYVACWVVQRSLFLTFLFVWLFSWDSQELFQDITLKKPANSTVWMSLYDIVHWQCSVRTEYVFYETLVLLCRISRMSMVAFVSLATKIKNIMILDIETINMKIFVYQSTPG